MTQLNGGTNGDDVYMRFYLFHMLGCVDGKEVREVDSVQGQAGNVALQ